MARNAADLALALAVAAGPDELTEGIGYKLALPPPRRDKLADFRVLVIDKHPLCPTASNVTTALNGFADRLGKTGCSILRESAKLPDLALTGRVYRELLSAFFSADTPREARERAEVAAKALSPDDPSYSAASVRGLWLGPMTSVLSVIDTCSSSQSMPAKLFVGSRQRRKVPNTYCFSQLNAGPLPLNPEAKGLRHSRISQDASGSSFRHVSVSAGREAA
jgi:Asp-tRNA(Asn)/Glu-tRNA(Gln) amidotransferase A subunit family amidase